MCLVAEFEEKEMKIIIPKWYLIYVGLILLIYFGSAVYFVTCKVAPRNYKDAQEIKQWEQKYNEEIAQKEEVFKQHPRMRKYFK